VRRAVISVTAALVVLAAIALAGLALAGGGDDEAIPSPAPSEAIEAPTQTPVSPGALPPEFIRCMADEGFAIESPEDIHSAPPQVLQTCFGSLHGG
jgi:hypothetical protein